MLRLLLATRNTWNGLVAAARSERAVQEELVVLVLAVPLAFVVGVSAWRVVALIGVLLVLLAVELLNTGLEKLADHVTLDNHPQIKYVKDLGSAAVGCALLLCRDGLDAGAVRAAGAYLTRESHRVIPGHARSA